MKMTTMCTVRIPIKCILSKSLIYKWCSIDWTSGLNSKGVHTKNIKFELFQYNEIVVDHHYIFRLPFIRSLSIDHTMMCASYDRQNVIIPFKVLSCVPPTKDEFSSARLTYPSEIYFPTRSLYDESSSFSCRVLICLYPRTMSLNLLRYLLVAVL